MKPYAEACDQNRDPILAVIEPLLTACRDVLEIGSGTGQHAVYFAGRMPHLVWHTSDLPEHHSGIRQWLDEAALPNTRAPLVLDVTQAAWPELSVDAVFSANTAHIMGWAAVQAMFRGLPRVLSAGGRFVLYGPFNYGGSYTSESNARFDQWLKARDPASGIRDFEALDRLAEAAGMVLEQDHPMPVNNRTLVWRRQEQP
jgi:cyclopropane fatty-acyl-phospholipid synthase-like methyltransferase